MSDKDPGYIVQEDVRVLQMSEKCNVPLEEVLAAHIIICDGKVFKNAWGRNYKDTDRELEPYNISKDTLCSSTNTSCGSTYHQIDVLELSQEHKKLWDNNQLPLGTRKAIENANLVICNGEILKNRWGAAYNRTNETETPPKRFGDNGLLIKESKIHGKGLFAKTNIPQGKMLGVAFERQSSTKIADNDIIRLPIGKYINHDDFYPNSIVFRVRNKYFIVTMRDISKNDEITIDYNALDFEGEREFYKSEFQYLNIDLGYLGTTEVCDKITEALKHYPFCRFSDTQVVGIETGDDGYVFATVKIKLSIPVLEKIQSLIQ